ncbi:PD-(D/E)XK nuclease family transposase [Fibrobacter sp.]|uniref:PD-(D/E)XK nuclease family transposase n=1 Tax=Fibrobacter sp. TaxID=35828 RepID=UPI0025BA4D90|nr:PD-(D/E)XK nuclease family transposase [Fibrobacter sp.]MBR3072028.1 PD-(D/E)XK nuclease family transposase [Fibrobacter sp.]
MLDLHDGDAIKEISLEMQEFPGVFCKKDCIVDIIGTTNAGEKVLVEVQQQGDDFYRDRVEYYTSRVIENQVHTSEKYELPRIYFLGLLDFTLFPEEPQKYIHHVDEMCNGRKFFPKIQKIFVEIEKFFRLEEKGISTNDCSEAAQWLRAIKVTINEEPVPEKIMQNETFKRLLDSVKLINFAEESLLRRASRELLADSHDRAAIGLHKVQLFNCEVKNVTDLMAEHEIGFAEGELKKAREMAKGLRDDGVPMEIIIRRSGLSEEEIRKL